jgi:hypothetical protein
MQADPKIPKVSPIVLPPLGPEGECVAYTM